jgi:hypothetical protein
MTVIDAYLTNTETRDEKTDKALIISLSEYDFQRNLDEISRKMGLSKSFLKSWRKPEEKSREPQEQGRALELEDVNPWPEKVSGEWLFSTIEEMIRSFLIAPDHAARIMAVWVALTYFVADLVVLPMIAFVSPVKRSGKTTALELIRRLSNRAIMGNSISPAAIFRTVEKYRPTLLIDEADTILRTNEDLRTLINGSFQRNSSNVFRVVGNELEPRAFSSFCPKCIALIGRLPDTVADRSVIIMMRRKAPGEKTERLRADRDLGFSEVKSMLARWVLDNKEEILSRDPDMPKSLNDRQADIFRELLRIADTIGGRWPGQIRIDAESICTLADEDGDTKTMLLEDIRTYFESVPGIKQVASQALIEYLIAIEGRPWAELRGGRPITPNTLARMLHGFGIEPKTIRVSNATPKGYMVDNFKEAFERYLSNRNTETNDIKYIKDKNLNSFEHVAVVESKSNTHELHIGNGVACCGLESKQKQEIINSISFNSIYLSKKPCLVADESSDKDLEIF